MITKDRFQELLDMFGQDYYSEALKYVLNGGDINKLYYYVRDQVLPYYPELKELYGVHNDVYQGKMPPCIESQYGRMIAGAMKSFMNAAIRDSLKKDEQEQDTWVEITDPKRKEDTLVSHSDRIAGLAEVMRSIQPGYYRTIWYKIEDKVEKTRDQVAVREASIVAGWVTRKADDHYKAFRTWTEKDPDNNGLIGLSIERLKEPELR